MTKYVAGLLITAVLFGCGGAKSPDAINGTITSRDGMSIAPNTMLHVELVQTSDGPEKIVRDTTFQITGQQAPIQFALHLGKDDLKRDQKYEVRAHVMDPDGRTTYSSSPGATVTAASANNVEIIVASTGNVGGATDTSAARSDSTRTDSAGKDTTHMRDTGKSSPNPGDTGTGGR